SDGHGIGQFPDEASVGSVIPEGEHGPPPGAVADQTAAVQRLVGNADSPLYVEGPERWVAWKAPGSPGHPGVPALVGQAGAKAGEDQHGTSPDRLDLRYLEMAETLAWPTQRS